MFYINQNNDLGQHWNSTLVYTGTGAWTAQAKVTIPKDGVYLILRGAFCGGSGVLVGEHYDSGKYTGVDGANVVGKYISVESKSKNDVVATYTFSTGETCAGVTVVYLGPKK